MTCTNEFNVADFVVAYVAGNKEAQKAAPNTEGWKSAYEIAEELGYERGSLAWDACVGGVAANYFQGHCF